MINAENILHKPSTRKCVIRFDQALPADTAQLLNNSLRQHDSIEGVYSEYSALFIQYRFPDMTLGMILSDVFNIVDISKCRAVNRLMNNIRVFTERNEKNFITFSCGWDRYIENIYMNCYDQNLNVRTDIRKQTWRKYK